MSEDMAIELAKLTREAVERARNKIAARQLGLDCTDFNPKGDTDAPQDLHD